MYIHDKYRFSKATHSSHLGNFFVRKAEQYLNSLLLLLDDQLDKRLVRTFSDVFISILRFRNRSFGLVLSELGAYVGHSTHAPAGTKRISKLLRSNKWTHQLVENHLLSASAKRLEVLKSKGKQVLFLWDDSVVEKPESWFSEGLCSVPSSKGKRLTRIKTVFFTPLKRVFVFLVLIGVPS
jgi:hypothetical protein